MKKSSALTETSKVKLVTVGPCKFCGNTWILRKPVMPERCGSCKRFNWQKESK